jgi:2',3'-cyclic-nucleotide 2'-phosphodiesterase (5'-nucleotidase family)
VWIPGNHELDYGLEQYQRFLTLAGNMVLGDNFSVKGQAAPAPWRLFVRNGIRIAVIGAQASFTANWLLPQYSAQCTIERADAMLQRVLPAVHRSKPDIIVLAAHQAWFEFRDSRAVNEIHDIAQRFPEIDLILGAHSHRLIPGQRIGRKSWYDQSGCHGEGLGVIQAQVDISTHRVIDISSEIVPVRADTPECPHLAQALRPWLERAEQAGRRVVLPALAAPISASGRPGVNCATSELICQAIAHATDADAVIHGKLSTKSLNGPIVTAADLFQLVPYENNIVLAEMTPEELAAIVSEQWSQRASYRFCGLWGRFCSINRAGKATLRNDAGSHNAKGPADNPTTASDQEKRLLVAMNSHTAAGSGVLPVLTGIIRTERAHCRDSGISTRDCVQAFLLQHPDIVITPRRWLIVDRAQ